MTKRLSGKVSGRNMVSNGIYGMIGKCGRYFVGEAIDKLAAYETAEEEGRLVVLPCKVGDVLYKPTRSFVSEYKVRFIEVSSCNCLFLHTSVVKGINDSGETFKEDDIGKTVFLTKEEAEKALNNKI